MNSKYKSINLINVSKLICNECPALVLRNNYIKWIKHCESLRMKELRKIGFINTLLLTESIPAKNFIYDLKTNSRLRNNIMKELNINNPEDLVKYLRSKGVLVVDLALCPIYKLKKKSDRRKAATLCFERHTYKYTELNPKAPNNMYVSKQMRTI